MTWGYFMSSLGNRIKSLRLSKRLQQAELADLCGISQPAIAKIERGITKTLKGETLDKLAYHLSSTTGFILHGSGSPDEHEDAMMAAEMAAIFKDLPTEDKETLLRMARGILPPKVPQIPVERRKTLLLPNKSKA